MNDKILPLMVSTFDTGGAATAALRLHHGLRTIGVESKFLTYSKDGEDDTIIDIRKTMNPILQSILRRSIKKNAIINRVNQAKGALYWSDNRRPNAVIWQINPIPHNILHFHWIGLGFIPISSFRWFHKPIIWTLHDSWAFTGGCHVPLDCQRFELGCGKCPQLDSSEDNDDSHAIFNAKLRAWHNQNFVVVAPSNWLAQRAAMSPLMKNKTILVIPNGIDLEKFTPMDKQIARQQLGLEPDKQYVTFGTLRIDDYNKGFDLLCSALHHINRHDHPIEIILFGNIPSNIQQKFEMPIHSLGLLSSVEQLRHVYAAADTLILPSRQENLSNTLMEAMAIGTPCVAFDIGGNSDLIVHQGNGYLASPFSTEDMAQGILWILNNTKTLSQNAREHIVKRFDLKNISKQHLDLYHFVYFDK